MFSAAYIAGLQAFVLPGLVILSLARRFAEPTFKWESVVIVSALFNIWAVLVTHVFSIPLYSVFWPLLCIELYALYLLYSRKPENVRHFLGGTLTYPLVGVGLLALVLFVALAFPHFGEIVHHWDAFAVWHPWASRFATGEPLGSTLSYPLGFPALASLIYAFNLNTREFTEFSRYIPLLTLAISFLVGATICRYVSFVSALYYVIGLFTTYNAINAKMGGYLLSLTADQSVATFFALSTLLLLVTVKDEENLSRFQIYTNLVIVGLSVSVTALIKQSGVPLIFSLCAFYFFASNAHSKERILRTISLAGVVFVCAGLWYVVEIGSVYLSSGEFNYSTLASERRHPFVGPENAYQLVVGHTKYAVHLLWISAALSLFDRRAALMLLFVIVPNVLVFAFATSYAFRHFIIMIPAILALGGIGLSSLVEGLGLPMLAGRRGACVASADVIAAVTIPLLLTIVLDGTITTSALEAHRKSQVYQLGWKHYNKLGIESVQDVAENSYYFSNYRVLGELPEFEKVKFEPGLNLSKIVGAAREDPSKPVRVLMLWYARQPENLHEQVDCLIKLGGARVVSRRERSKGAPASHLLLDVDARVGGLETCLTTP